LRIAKRSLHIKELRDAFAHDQSISVHDLIQFFQRFEETVKRSTVDWRIYELTKLGILHRIGRGSYSLSKTYYFKPEVSRSLKLLFGIIKNQFPYLNICVWNTKLINEFMLHQPGRFYTILEVDKDAMESVFYDLKDQGRDVFLNPSEEVLSKYVVSKKEPIIITSLITEAPLEEIDGVKTTSLEKVLVDICSNETLFSAQQGAELTRIYETAFEKYTISETKLLRYARRRNKKEVVEQQIKKQRNGNKY
jgi:hypothetical protein